jgi:hypothetical protein
MSSGTFNYVLELLLTSIRKQNTNFRMSISPEERLTEVRMLEQNNT